MDYRTRVSVAARQSPAVSFALDCVGSSYKFGGLSPSSGIDCSGLTLRAAAAVQVGLDHNSSLQVIEFRSHRALISTDPRSPLYRADAGKLLVPGCVAFYYGTVDEPESVSHCALYVGRNTLGPYMVISAVDTRYGVRRQRLGQWSIEPVGYGLTHKMPGYRL